MKTFLITGGNLVNKGAQAMLLITMNEIRERYPDAIIYYTTHEREDGSEKVYKMNYMYKYSLLNALGRTSNLLFGLDYVRAKTEQIAKCIIKKNYSNIFSQKNYEKLIKDIDVLIDISGYNLSSQWPLRISKNYLNTIKYAHAHDIDIYLMPQSFGPFDYGKKQDVMDKEISQVLSYAKMIFAREPEGYNYLVKKYGLKNVKLSYDLVLQNKYINPENIFKDTCQQTNVLNIKTKNNVGIIPNIRSSQNMQGGEIVDLYEKLINKLLLMDKNIYLIYHSKEDIALCKQIKSKCINNEKVIFIEDDLNCYEYEDMIKDFDFLIASRFHSIIHAYKENVPCIVLGWAQKYHDLLNAFNQSKYLFDVRESVDFLNLESSINCLNDNLIAEKETIKNNLKVIQENNCFDEVFELINKK